MGARILARLLGRFRHWWFAGGFAAAVLLHTARATLDEALGALHPANELPYGTNRLHDGPDVAAQALSSWDRGSAEFARFLRGRVDGRALARLHTLAEVGYTLVISGLLLALVAWVFNRVTNDDPEMSRLRRGILRWAGILVPVYLGLGLLDQALDWLLLRAVPTGSPAQLSRAAAGMAHLLQISSVIRRLSLLAIIVPLIVGLLTIARSARPAARMLAAGSPFRVLITVIALYTVILNAGPPGEQAADAIRLWSHSRHLIIVAILAVGWLSATVFVIARRVDRRVDQADAGPDAGPDARRAARSSEWARTGRIARYAICLIAVGVGIERWRHWGGGIGMLGALLGVVAGLNALLLLVVPSTGDEPTGETISVERDITAEIPVTVADPTATATIVTEPAAPASSPFLPSLLGFLPYVVLGRAILRAAIPEAISPGGSLWLAPVGVLVAVIGCVLYVASRRPTFFAVGDLPGRFDTAFRRWLLGSAVLLAVIMVSTWFHPWNVGRALGVHGLLPAFLTGLTVGIGGLSYLTEGWAVPGALRLVGVRRVPIVSGLLAWGVAASLLGSDYHDVRILDATAPAKERTFTAASAFNAWTYQTIPAQEFPTDPAVDPMTTRPTIAGRKPAVPMVFVAAAGGGIRAASFTSVTLDCLLARIDIRSCENSTLPNNWNKVFALSGASGGSVGIASTTAQLGSTGPAADWVADRLGGDLLSPSLAWQLFVEAPNTLLHLSPDMDRGEVIERSWENRWADDPQPPATPGPVAANQPDTNPATQPVLGLDDSWTRPLLLLNGTNLRDSCRVNLSRIDGSDPAVESSDLRLAERDCRRQRLDDTIASRTGLAVNRDVTDYLCPTEDLRLSTAAFLSARFPFVSPTGNLRSAPDREAGCPKADMPPLAIADGGYRDNTGASALLELWSQIAPLVEQHNRTMNTCVVPLFIEIDNGHRNRNAAGEPGPLGQLLAPLTGGLSVFGSRDAGWIEQAANEFSRPLGPGVKVLDPSGAEIADRFTRLSLFAHPGVQAPLGWSLSPEAVADISGQLTVPENVASINEVVSWLNPGGLTCEIA